jgi:hypothetical protein
MSDQLLTCKDVRTRKQHRCSMCGKRIRKGALARYWAGTYDGDFQSGYAHGVCNHLWQKLVWPDSDELLDEGDFRREILGLPLLKVENPS